MPLPLAKVRSLKLTSIFEFILYLLENVSEEKFWHSILGERLTRLCQRYFGNDFVMLGILFYIAPILRTNWQQLLEFCFNRVVKQTKTLTVRVYYHDSAYNAIDSFIKKNTEEIPGLTEAVGTYNYYNDDEEEHEKPQIGLYPRNNTTNMIQYKGYDISVAHQNEDDDDEKSTRPSYISVSIEVSPFESIDTLKSILQDWADLYNNSEDNSIDILKWDGYDNWNYKDKIDPRSIDSVNLPKGVKENVLNDMERFLKSQDWYQKRFLPYRRGYLLYGIPGTGKTSLIQALAGQLQLDIALIKLTEITSDSEFQNMVSKVPEKTLIVIEDIDHYDSTDTENTISVSGLLNGLDGINGNNGSMVFMTCNDMNKLEPALLRPGRIDIKLEFGYAVHDQVEAMFWRFFDVKEDEEKEEKQVKAITEKDTTTTTTTTTTTAMIKKKDSKKDDFSLPPTPPNEQESDNESEHQDEENDNKKEDKEKHKAFLKEKLDEFLTMIPEHTVTTAELQNLFVTVFLEAGPDNGNDQGILDKLFAQVPEFLERTKLDREQAKIHNNKKDVSKKDEDDKDKKDEDKEEKSSTAKDENENTTCQCKKAEVDDNKNDEKDGEKQEKDDDEKEKVKA